MNRKSRWPVCLTPEDEELLRRLVSSGVAPARKINRARILLKLNDTGKHEVPLVREVAEALECSRQTVITVRRDYVLGGLEGAIERTSQPERPDKRILDGVGEAHLIALACGQPPPGHAAWTLKLLADKLVELGICDTISDETVRQVMKKKRAEALAKAPMVHPSRSKRRLRLRDGRRP
jgi:hypothetical protein